MSHNEQEWLSLERLSVKALESISVSAWAIADELCAIRHILQRAHPRSHTATRIGLTATPIAKGVAPMSPITPVSTTTNFDLELVAVPADAAGNPVADTLTWSSSSTAVADVPVADATDPNKAKSTIKGTGTCTITVTDGAGLTNSVDITVSAGGAVTIGLTATAVAK